MVVRNFDFDDRRIYKDGDLLILRTKGEVSELTFKQMVSQERAKIMKEYEIVFRAHDDAEKILTCLGLKETNKYTKHRTSFKLGEVSFEFDKYSEIPTFLEIEAPTVEEVEKYVKVLGFSAKDAKPWTGLDVFKHYGKKM